MLGPVEGGNYIYPVDNTLLNGSPGSTNILTSVNLLFLLATMFVLFRVVTTVGVPPRASSEASGDASISTVLPALLSWFGLSASLVCFNKYMYLAQANGGFGFPFPLAITWFHMLAGVLATNVIKRVRPDWMPVAAESRVSPKQLVRVILPIGIVFALYLGIGNRVYLYLPVSFVQMLRSAGPLSVFAVSVAAGQEKFTMTSLVVIFVIITGVASASFGEVNFSWFGLALQMVAFILDGFRLVLLKTLMSSQQGVKLDPLSALYYYSPVCVVTLILPVAYFEAADLHRVLTAALLEHTLPSLLCAVLLNASVAFALNLSLLALFGNVGATTLSVAATCRDICLTFASAWIFHSHISQVQVIGYLSACIGVKLWDELKARPEAFDKAFGIRSGEKLPLVDRKSVV